jgi:hypothetical protein
MISRRNNRIACCSDRNTRIRSNHNCYRIGDRNHNLWILALWTKIKMIAGTNLQRKKINNYELLMMKIIFKPKGNALF